MEIGKQGSFRLRLIDLDSGKSRTITIYARDPKPSLSELMKKIIKALRGDE